MRERLVAVIVGVTFVVISLYGVPRAYFLANQVENDAERSVSRSSWLIALVLAERESGGGPVDGAFLDGLLADGESLTYEAADGTVVTAGTREGSSDSDVVATRELPDGGAVTLTRSGEVVQGRITRALLPLIFLGVGLLAFSAAVASMIARRLARPFQELAVAATDLGRGRFDREVRHYRVPEAEAIATALRTSAGQLDSLIKRERDFAVTASHELLTPLAATRLELEDLSLRLRDDHETGAQLQASIVALDRFTEAVHGLLEQDREARQSASADLDLGVLAEQIVVDWQPRLADDGREIRVERRAAVRLHAVPREMAQMLDELIRQACEGGEGTVVVDVGEEPSFVVVGVSDDGPRRYDASIVHGARPVPGSAPLAAAALLAEAQGGYVSVEESPLTRVRALLPRTG
jgi:signal transduction histidine kinase